MTDRSIRCRRLAGPMRRGPGARRLAVRRACRAQDAGRFQPVPLRSRITRVQPMTGIVLWATSEHNKTNAIQLEYSYMKYGDVVKERGQYDWRVMDRLLDRVAARRHQAIVRFYLRLPGEPDDGPRLHQGDARLPRDARHERGEADGVPRLDAPGAPGVHARVLREDGGALRQRPAAGVRRDGVRPLGRVPHLFRAEGDGQDVPRQGVPGRVRPPARSRLPQDALDDLG